MTDAWHCTIPHETRLRLLAELIATKVTAGDMITLTGDLGAGKTTFARYLIRAMLDDDLAEIPSPTFALVQVYETPRFEVRHFDLYRLTGPRDLDELDFEDVSGEALTIVEWPGQACGELPPRRFDIALREAPGGDPDARIAVLSATAPAADRAARLRAAYEFLTTVTQPDALGALGALDGLRIRFLQGDASARGYARITTTDGQRRLLMDMPRMPDGPVIRDGRSYSAIAHLAEDARPFVAIAHELRAAGLSAPEIHAFDEPRGMALIEDLGPLTFGEAIAGAVGGVGSVVQEPLWLAAATALVALRSSPPRPLVGDPTGVNHRLPAYDADVMTAEVSLLCDWYWAHTLGEAMAPAARAAFDTVWQTLIGRVATGETAVRDAGHWVLRDFHSPNLLWLPEREGIAKVGIIDFQDAQIGHAAYDLVSLSLDARLDVPRHLHDMLLDRYCSDVRAAEPDFDSDRFREAAAILGAQRNTKILGIFARLAMRDGKSGYLAHLPRIRRYLGWCLEHPALAALAAWHAEHLPLLEH